jgi:hypothetical protein
MSGTLSITCPAERYARNLCAYSVQSSANPERIRLTRLFGLSREPAGALLPRHESRAVEPDADLNSSRRRSLI